MDRRVRVGVICNHLTLVPTVGSGEVKTKPTQHLAQDLREIGIQADILLCCCDEELSVELKKKMLTLPI